MLKNITTYFVALMAILALPGCRDDESWNPYNTGEDGVISISLSVPEPVKVITRAEQSDAEAERRINELAVLIYNADGERVQVSTYPDSEDIVTDDSNEDYKTSFTLALNSEAAKLGNNMTLIVVANANSLVNTDDSKSLTDLNTIKDNADLSSRAKGFVMSGKLNGSLSKTGTNSIVLTRTAAKFTGVVDDVEETKDFLLDNIQIRNTATYGYVTAGSENTFFETVGAQSSLESDRVYTYPTKKENAFIIVEGTYKGQPGNFYKIEMAQTNETTGQPVYLDVNANHWYELHIIKVSGPGYSTADLAAASPSSNIEGKIYDNVPTVLSMASDGTRELGVTKEVNYRKGEMSNDVWTDSDNKTSDFTIRLHSLASNEPGTLTVKTSTADKIVYTTTDGSLVTVEITEGKDWLDFRQASIVGNGSSDVQMLYNLGYRKTALSGVKEGEITVTWKGLERTVKVIWEQKFDATEICSVKLTIHDTDNSKTYVIGDYWKFLSGEGSSTSQEYASTGNAPHLWGVGKEDNCGEVRDQGFHFPVMYGDDSKINNPNKWWYEYEITFNNDVTVKSLSSAYSYNQNGRVITLKSNYNDYTYDPDGSLQVTVDGVDYDFDVYHTGFFHYDNTSSYRKANGSADSNPGYYYYEVISMGDRHWLDRNLGAKANGISILDNANKHIITPDDNPYYAKSQGAYYKPAQDAQGDYVYASTRLYTKEICPPGYRFPSTTEFDLVRNSSNFVSGQTSHSGATFYTAYFMAGNRKVYFPKVKFVEGATMTGEANAGYYWTANDAFGLEKDEIGRWLQALCFNGASNNYINGNVNTYGMSVRCVANETDSKADKVTSFNVTGATHVYIYRKSNGAGVFQWPGKAIGDAETMKTKTINFVYTSAYDPSELMVLFNYVDNKGRIYTFSNNDFTGNDDLHYNMQLSDIVGWQVIGESPSEVAKDDHNVTLTPAGNATTSNIGATWACKKAENGYQIHRQKYNGADDNNWESIDMIQDSNGLWSLTAYFDRVDFGIRKNENGNSTWINASGASSISSQGGSFSCSTSGTNFSIQSAGNYKLTFNPSTMELSVTPIQNVNKTYTYRIYAPKSLKFYQWDSSGTISLTSPLIDGVGITSDVNGYNCYEFTCTEDQINTVKYCYEMNCANTEQGRDWSIVREGSGRKLSDFFGNSSSETNCAYIDVKGEAHKGKPSARDLYVVYFRKSDQNNGWENVYAYCYGNGDNAGWPGVKMTDLNRDNVYYYETSGEYPNIIFNNNSGTQTANLEFKSGWMLWSKYGNDVNTY